MRTYLFKKIGIWQSLSNLKQKHRRDSEVTTADMGITCLFPRASHILYIARSQRDSSEAFFEVATRRVASSAAATAVTPPPPRPCELVRIPLPFERYSTRKHVRMCHGNPAALQNLAGDRKGGSHGVALL